MVPRDYRRVLEIMRAAEAAGRDVDDAVMSALALSPPRRCRPPRGRSPRRWLVPDPNGFLRYDRRLPARRPVPVRISDWREVYPPAGEELIREQATRCMDCGIPFCHDGCPLGNRIPDWNDLVRTGDWDAAVGVAARHQQLPRVHRPALPGALRGGLRARHRRPAAGDHQAGRGGDRRRGGRPGLVTPAAGAGAVRPVGRRGRLRARPGWPPPSSWPAPVTRSPCTSATTRSAACCATASPTSSWRSGTSTGGWPSSPPRGCEFRTGVNVGVDVTAEQLRAEHDAVLLACGALPGRDTPATPGRALRGVHQAMDAPGAPPTGSVAAAGDAAGRHADRRRRQARGDHRWWRHRAPTAWAWRTGRARPACTSSTSTRSRRAARDEARDPWPTWPWILRNYPAHEEGGERVFAVAVQEFVDDGTGAGPGGPDRRGDRREAGRPADRHRRARLGAGAPGRPGAAGDRLRGHRAAAAAGPARGDPQRAGRGRRPAPTGRPRADGVFVAGDMHRGASLIVWAIAEGRAAAAAIHALPRRRGRRCRRRSDPAAAAARRPLTRRFDPAGSGGGPGRPGRPVPARPRSLARICLRPPTSRYRPTLPMCAPRRSRRVER